MLSLVWIGTHGFHISVLDDSIGNRDNDDKFDTRVCHVSIAGKVNRQNV